MSQAQTPRSNVMQALLLAATVFLGYNMFCQNKQAPDIRDSKVIYNSIEQMNRDVKDISIVAEDRALGNRLDSEVANKVLTKPAADEIKFKSRVLVADTQYKGAVIQKDFQRMTAAQMTLTALKNEFKDKPFFNSPIAVGALTNPIGHLTRSQVTVEELEKDILSQSEDLGKTTLVWGFFPGFQVIDALVSATGRHPAFSYAIACLLLAICVRIIVWPFAQKQFMWGRQMSQLSPMLKEIDAEFGAQSQEGQKRKMEIFSEYGINPVSGCIPAFLQMPLFLLIYQSMLHYKYEFQHGTFLWVNESFSKATNGFIAPNLGGRDIIMIVLYAASMIATTMLAPVSDPTNARQQRLIGIAVAVLFPFLMVTGAFPVPAAFVLYWIFTNIFASVQSLRAYRLPLPPLVKKNAPNGGVFPGSITGSIGSVNGKAKPNNTGTPQRFKPKKKK